MRRAAVDVSRRSRTGSARSSPRDDRSRRGTLHTALTIAGSDPSGGWPGNGPEGLSVLRHWTGSAVATALTVQDADCVHEAGFIDAVTLIASADVLLRSTTPHCVSLARRRRRDRRAHRRSAGGIGAHEPARHRSRDSFDVGRRALGHRGRPVLRDRLIRRATVVTPNLAEARILADLPVADATSAGRALIAMGARLVVVTGGHLPGDRADDVVVSAESVRDVRAAHAWCVAARDGLRLRFGDRRAPRARRLGRSRAGRREEIHRRGDSIGDVVAARRRGSAIHASRSVLFRKLGQLTPMSKT